MASICISVIIPVYKGAETLAAVVANVAQFFEVRTTPTGHQIIINEVLLVHDCGPDDSASKIKEIALLHHQIRPVWLTKNFGQHAATIAGMSSATGDWVVTMDEDGLHNPSDIVLLIDCALNNDYQVVYAMAENAGSHGIFRNWASNTSKLIGRWIAGNEYIQYFHSYRLVQGEIARALAAYCGNGVYLDVALLWIAGRIGRQPLKMSAIETRPSGYNFWKLIMHFRTMLITMGTRPLHLITFLGAFSVFLALVIGCYVIYQKFYGKLDVAGWASLVITISFFSGCIMLALGMLAEYIAMSMGIAMGKPLYVISSKPSSK